MRTINYKGEELVAFTKSEFSLLQTKILENRELIEAIMEELNL